MNVTWWRSTASTSCGTDHRPRITTVPPKRRWVSTWAGTVATNDIEPVSAHTLRSGSRYARVFDSAMAATLRCVMTAPFGLPVVPLVYPMMNGSSPFTATATSGSVSPWWTSVSNAFVPGGAASGTSPITTDSASGAGSPFTTARWSALHTMTRGVQSATRTAASVGVRRVLIGTMIAPTRAAARYSSTYSIPSSTIAAMRSPGSAPRRDSDRASERTVRDSSA